MSNTHRRCNPGSRPSRLSQAIQGILLASALTASAAAHGEDATNRKSYHISGGSLGQALSQFARDAGILFTGESTLTDGKTSKGLEGEYTIEEGFKKLLAGSGLTYTITEDNAVAIKVAEPGSDAASTLPAVKVLGKAVYDSTDPYNTDYNRPNASTATKTDTPIMETPLNIQVIPRQVLKDTQAIHVKDALKNVSGTFWSGDYSYDGFQMRGFIADGFTTVYRNGLRLRRTTNEVANIDQMEILKGPAAAAYGRIEPGGLINLVTKKPLDTPYYSLEQQFGSYDFYRTTIDATGPVTKDKTLLYRVNLAYKNNNTFIDMLDQERVMFAPSLTWKPSDRTEVNFNLEYQYDKSRYYVGLPIIGQKPAPIPLNRFLGFGADNEFQTFDKVLVGFDWSHQFNDNWKIQQRFHYYNLDYLVNNSWCCSSNTVQADNRSLTRSVSHTPYDKTDTYATNIDLTGKFDLFGTKNQVLAGFDFFREDVQSQGFFKNPAPAEFRPVVDIYNPVYGSIPQLSDQSFNTFNTLSQYWYGAYFQDQITLWDKLHILGGGRYDWATRRSGSSSSSLASAEQSIAEVQNEAFSPRVGLVYQPWPWLSVYGNYTESLGAANTASAANGVPLDAERAQQHEVGFKTEFFDKKLTSTVAFYDLTKQNVATADPQNPRFSIPVGEARSQGIEVDIKGQINDALSFIATYAYTDSRITKDNRGNQGHRIFNIPENAGSFWAKYDVQNKALRGLSFGTGAYIVGSREGNNANTWGLPGYVRVDSLLRYAWKVGSSTVSAQLNVNNLLDKTYYESAAYGGVTVIPGAPRTFLGSIRVEF